MSKDQKHFPVKALIRIRPGNNFLEYTDKIVKIEKENGIVSEFHFDKVLGPNATQNQVFKSIKEELTRFKEGYNTTIFCYGNTGAGKTHTMIGNSKQQGLIYNVIGELLKENHDKRGSSRHFDNGSNDMRINKDKEFNHNRINDDMRINNNQTNDNYFNSPFLSISYLEIYNEKVYDLLDPKELNLREFNGVILVPGLSTKKIFNLKDFDLIFKKGLENRTTGETKLNQFSSRSHSILRIQRGDVKLHLIDLAGSENNRKTGNEGVRLTESSNINRSLFVLAKVVNSIINKEIRIPYRDSKLTRLLQDSLGGNSICCIIANINDDESCIGDTINTLMFAHEIKKDNK
ncbi:Kinesin-like protein KIF22 [Nosema bombycis CQ1]|uniref:Kinesin-like protein KIF22 n=1 Tax=Nosema bombycis (strain CQ1 / CVCC 102059) TaxID=578461 RepID=R0KTE8_NOSB1|nr:Kinesin-like protein KIF22 [Nosema bombycis CQ1]|eukprot:EOB14086.1 Kinesin-like protein KIF22 [Nosema bombycis CQ1]